MSIRVHQLAKQLEMENGEVMRILRTEFACEVASPSSQVGGVQAKALLEKYKDWAATATNALQDDATIRTIATESATKQITGISEAAQNLSELKGVWDEGYALDLHTLSSVACGVSMSGRTQFSTTYTFLGDLVHRCKYNGEALLVSAIAAEVVKRFPRIVNMDLIIPVPSAQPDRKYQHVLAIATEINRITGVQLIPHAFSVKPHAPLKNIGTREEKLKLLKEHITLSATPDILDKNVLLFDDIFQSGATLSVLCELLRPLRPSKLSVVTVTKTRSKK